MNEKAHRTLKAEFLVLALAATGEEPPLTTCSDCGAPFAPLARGLRDALRCGNCERVVLRARRKAAKVRRRRTQRLAFVEPVSAAKVRARDRGLCYFCSTTVPETTTDPERAPALHHIVPLARGGEHSYRNVALAHTACNRQASDHLDTKAAALLREPPLPRTNPYWAPFSNTKLAAGRRGLDTIDRAIVASRTFPIETPPLPPPFAFRDCPRCERTLPVEAFARNRSASSGMAGYCRDCHSTVNARYYREKERDPSKGDRPLWMPSPDFVPVMMEDPGKLDPALHRERLRMYRRGLTDSDIAAVQGVSRHAVRDWRVARNLRNNRLLVHGNPALSRP